MAAVPDGPCEFVTTPFGGPLHWEGSYRDGLRDGLWRIMRVESGTPAWETTWTAGEWHGPARGWYRNGQLEYEGSYAHGNHAGGWSYWYETGRLAAQGRYEADRKAGEWRYWDKDGTPLEWAEWETSYGLGDYDWAYDDYTGMPRGENWPHPPNDSPAP